MCSTVLTSLCFSGLDVPVPGGPPGQGPRLQVRALQPGQVSAPVHAAVAPGPRPPAPRRAREPRVSHVPPRARTVSLPHVYSECHRVVIIIENCDVSNQKIQCLAQQRPRVLTTLLSML